MNFIGRETVCKKGEQQGVQISLSGKRFVKKDNSMKCEFHWQGNSL